MTQVDFYILEDKRPQTRLITACRLADKGYQSGARVYIHCDDDSQRATMDDLLWTFRDGSFIPHANHPAPEGDRSPVRIGAADNQPWDADLLINVSAEVPAFVGEFARVLEIIDGDPDRRQQGRLRYRFYKENDYPVSDHKL